MNLPELTWLRSAAGAAVLAELAARDLHHTTVLAESTRLRRELPADLARAAIELATLRQRARAKFRAAERMFFTRDALEQASSELVAQHRAQRLAACGQIADLGCGIGGDSLALAAQGAQVLAVDRDPLRLALLEANAEALGVAALITLLERDVLADGPPSAAAIFCDPGRRAAGKRRFAAEEFEPPLSTVLSWRKQTPALAIKLAPGIDLAALPSDTEVEFVSLDGELKEAVVWCPPLAAVPRRASLLTSAGACHSMQGSANPAPTSVTPPQAMLYEPDPAVIRAGLVTDLARELGASQLDPSIAYLTAPHAISTPFARGWRIIQSANFNLKHLRSALRSLGAGPVTVKKRGSPLDTDALARKLSGDGPNALVVVLTQHLGQPISLICHGEPER